MVLILDGNWDIGAQEKEAAKKGEEGLATKKKELFLKP